jgi:hypothetical protein
MRSRSNISSSLGKKRRHVFYKRFLICSILVFILLVAGIYCLYLDNLKIKDISVSGNSTVSQDEIVSIVKNELNKKDLWLIPTDNFFFFKRLTIPKKILEDIKKINTVSIYFSDFNKIIIDVSERTSKNLWCNNLKGNLEKCYFMDDQGFVYADAPDFDENLFPKYFGLITSSNPIGQNYFNNSRFSEISKLFSDIKGMNFNPVSFNAISNDEYEVGLALGGKIMLNNEKVFQNFLIDLKTLVNNGYIKTDDSTLSKLNHIDLRFGNKVHFDFRL